MANIIETFYQAFADLDADAMVACYHKEIIFDDPAFGELRGESAGNMWRMLCDSQKGKDFKVEYRDIVLDGLLGRAHWEAWYTFSPTKRKVHNVIEASFEIKEGLIFRHSDYFSFYRWSKQALGPVGTILGWTPFIKNKFQEQARVLLQKFEEKNQ